jgi:hypothetical protein
MRRLVVMGFVLFCAWIVGCTSFIKQSRSDFFSTEKGPNTDAFAPEETKDAKTSEQDKK